VAAAENRSRTIAAWVGVSRKLTTYSGHNPPNQNATMSRWTINSPANVQRCALTDVCPMNMNARETSYAHGTPRLPTRHSYVQGP
jgi:hypothetical protein